MYLAKVRREATTAIRRRRRAPLRACRVPRRSLSEPKRPHDSAARVAGQKCASMGIRSRRHLMGMAPPFSAASERGSSRDCFHGIRVAVVRLAVGEACPPPRCLPRMKRGGRIHSASFARLCCTAWIRNLLFERERARADRPYRTRCWPRARAAVAIRTQIPISTNNTARSSSHRASFAACPVTV